LKSDLTAATSKMLKALDAIDYVEIGPKCESIHVQFAMEVAAIHGVDKKTMTDWRRGMAGVSTGCMRLDTDRRSPFVKYTEQELSQLTRVDSAYCLALCAQTSSRTGAHGGGPTDEEDKEPPTRTCKGLQVLCTFMYSLPDGSAGLRRRALRLAKSQLRPFAAQDRIVAEIPFESLPRRFHERRREDWPLPRITAGTRIVHKQAADMLAHSSVYMGTQPPNADLKWWGILVQRLAGTVHHHSARA